MPLDPRVERFLTLLAPGQSDRPHDESPARRRRSLVDLMKMSGPLAPIAGQQDHTMTTANGTLALRIYTPLNAPPEVIPGSPELMPGLIYFHGGGLVAGSVATHESVARSLTLHGCCRVISVEYRLAPEHPFPAAIDDAVESVRHIAANAPHFGVDPQRLGICGDSAGAALAAAASHYFASRLGAPRLVFQLLLCPILDFSRQSESRRTFAAGYLIDDQMILNDLQQYALPGTNLSDPRLSPLRASCFSGLPHTLIHAAEYDPFRDEAAEYSEQLMRADSAVSYTCHVGMIHLFYALGAVIPYAKTAFEQIGHEIRASFGLQEPYE